MRHTKILTVSLVGLFSWATLSAQINELPRVTPEAEGVPSKAVMAYFDSIMGLKTTEIHSALLMRHGKVIGEIYPAPFSAEYGHTLFSCSKTFTSAAVGIAIGENRLRLTDRVAAFFPECLPDSISPWLASMTVEDLLTMRSGFDVNGVIRTAEKEWVRSYLAVPIVAEPGTRFAYDSMDTYLLSAIVTKVTGMKVFDYLKPRLFEPLHIEKVNWEYSPENITSGGWGLYLQAESLAKFGQLLLNKGAWNGKQLIPASWVEQMMAIHTPTGGDSYCYQMWACDHPNTARADGAYGQYIIVMPDEEMVAVITQSATGDDGAHEQRFLFKNLLPTISNEALPTTRETQQLAKKQTTYQHPFAEGKSSSAKVSNYAGRYYQLEKNSMHWKGFSIEQKGKLLVLTIDAEETGKNQLSCGYRSWTNSSVATRFPLNARRSTLGSFSGFSAPFMASSSYGWKNANELEVKIHFVDWMSGLDLSFHFDGDQPYLQAKKNYESEPFTVHFHE